ncbi:alpha/beta hydrolase [Pseudoduganella chitinolytica]|uniref:Alpha/beta hydrolase-fold protein n=1 Tax=Pseudoduganella chitinolytica TaxID=34070 RepID=A0ABY8B8F9_9BURK|nr:alpha/beta hydrolase-fold protein [Pseudoduganella chitinolytica]WEF31703.1 alpha/beta hydrolase-fold protein [Pseudoduganella chitinolytica]
MNRSDFPLRRLAAAALLAGAAALACAQGGTIALEGAPYVLEGTEVRSVRAQNLQRDYQIYVSLPPSYAKSGRSYPVVFVTDAPYAFPVTRAIGYRAGRGGKAIEEFILVGLSYARGDSAEYSRRRDYTPTPSGDTSLVADMPGREPKFGEAASYRRFIADEVFPFVAKHYRADMGRKTFIGHSYGSLLGLDMLLNEPEMFDNYVLGSPSLWFNKRVMFEREKAYAAGHKDLRANVLFAVGSYEAVRHGPRFNKDEDMVRDVRNFTAALKSRNYPNLNVTSIVVPDEDHLTIAPVVITRGLRWALPGSER